MRTTFAPDSVGLLVALASLGVVLMLLVAYRSPVAVRLVAGSLALVTVFGAGIVAVNVYFGYFASWTDVTQSFGADPAAVPVAAGPGAVLTLRSLRNAVAKTVTSPEARLDGSLFAVPLPGARSRVHRTGLVWLPPQYGEAAYARTRFPVLELIPGTPGQPSDWITALQTNTTLAAMTTAGRIAPMVVVMAPSNPPIGSGRGQECTNAVGGAQDSTYMGADVPADIAADFRVAAPGRHWGIAGYSSGGYCAADLALRYPRTYGAVGDLDGYLSPLEDGGLWRFIFHRDPTAIASYDIPTALAGDTHRLPAFYLAAGSSDRGDLGDLILLRTLLGDRTAVTSTSNPGGHTFPTWRAELPAMFTWLSDRIRSAPPARSPSTMKVENRLPAGDRGARRA